MAVDFRVSGKLREIVPFRIDVEVARQLYLSFF
jgi:hypothetical protein